MMVLVFNTNRVCRGCLQTVGSALSGFGTAIRRNADPDDCDRMLRVEAAVVPGGTIIGMMHEAGFRREELG